jgi:succinate-semialdehyde dehydrogenase/glutarate-semialdehyde dehydrogenase
MSVFQLINPATEAAFQQLSAHSASDIEERLAQAHQAFWQWGKKTYKQRAEVLHAVALSMKRNSGLLAQQISEEMGKITAEAQSEIDKCAMACGYYAQTAESLLSDRDIPTEFKKSYVSHQPLGVILGILPWNFPFWQFFRFAAPTLMAGNTIVFKHAASTMGCGETIQQLFEQVGAPYLVQHLRIDVDQVSALIADRRVRGVSLTGSTRAGRSVGQLAGQHLKPVVLELGGSDAYVILDDADLKLATDRCIQGRFLNCGQSCVSAKRFIVTSKNAEAFEGLLKERIQKIRYGAPMTKVEMGPMARKDLRDQLHDQVVRSKQQGLRAVIGGEIPHQTGFYYPATLLVGAKPGTVPFDEELFGPVATIAIAESEEQALKWANASNYGLGSAIFSKNTERAERLAVQYLDAGMAFINDFVRSDIHLPFGGIKDSGLGRELSVEGIRSFVNSKTICLS